MMHTPLIASSTEGRREEGQTEGEGEGKADNVVGVGGMVRSCTRSKQQPGARAVYVQTSREGKLDGGRGSLFPKRDCQL